MACSHHLHHQNYQLSLTEHGLLDDNKPDTWGVTSVHINHSESFISDIGRLYNRREYSDCVLQVGDQAFYLNKAILAERSSYFRALLFGGLTNRNSKEPIKINEDDVDIFVLLLQYVYCGTLEIPEPNADVLIDILVMVNRYGFSELEKDISKMLESYISFSNVILILNAAVTLNIRKLENSCFQAVDKFSTTLFESIDLKDVSKDTMTAILKRDSFYMPEDQVFSVVRLWHELNKHSIPVEEVTDCVRLPLVSEDILFTDVRDSKLWNSDTLFEVLRIKNLKSNSLTLNEVNPTRGCLVCRPRGQLVIDENLATQQRGARVIEGECGPSFLSAGMNFRFSEVGQCFARHEIGGIESIIVQLQNPSIINHIRFILKHWESRTMRSSHSTLSPSKSYKYHVEVSDDCHNWIRVCDHDQYLCRSLQHIYFPDTVARYVKLRGTGNVGEKTRFTIMPIGVFYTANRPEMHEGIVIPTWNVAVTESATVISGVSRVNNALIDENYTRYDWDSGYTCHQLGSGSIIIQLGQPYFIGSCRMLLWDRDDRVYNYTIETSSDYSEWQMVVDRSTVDCSSWQILSFEPRVVVFIRITGLRNSANEMSLIRRCLSNTSSKPFVTTPMFYVNAEPHVGHLYSAVLADSIYRWHCMRKGLRLDEGILTVGTDEHGMKVLRSCPVGVSLSSHCDNISRKFQTLFDVANISYTHFLRTTSVNGKCEANKSIFSLFGLLF